MNPYQILDIPQSASADEIKAAYHRLAKQWHPDRFSGAAKAEAEVRFREVAEAFNLLKDPVRRAELDQRLAKPGASEAPKPTSPPPASRTPGDWFEEAKRVYAEGDRHRALGLVQYAIRLDGNPVDYHRFYAKVLDELRGDLRQRIRTFENVHRMVPEDPEIIVRLAELYEEAGLVARSQRMWEMVRTIAPKHTAVRAKTTGGSGAPPKPSKGPSSAEQPSLLMQLRDWFDRFTKKDR